MNLLSDDRKVLIVGDCGVVITIEAFNGRKSE